ncbi:MAG: P-II family nitrogen regulator [Polyangiaceae bacterium]|jgi:nitrogen regulatory protein PII
MKHLEVIMPPSRFDDLKDDLVEAGVPGMTVSEAKVFGPATRRREVYLGSPHNVDFARQVKIEIVVRDDVVPRILEVLERAIRDTDDTKILISDVVETVRIRTGERGEEAIACHDSLPRQAELGGAIRAISDSP